MKKRRVELDPKDFRRLCFHVILKILHDYFAIEKPLRLVEAYGYFKMDRERQLECIFCNFVLGSDENGFWSLPKPLLRMSADVREGEIEVRPEFPHRHLKRLAVHRNLSSLDLRILLSQGCRSLEELYLHACLPQTLSNSPTYDGLLHNTQLKQSLRVFSFGIRTLDAPMISMINDLKSLEELWIIASGFSLLPIADKCKLRLPSLNFLELCCESVNAPDMKECGLIDSISEVLGQLYRFSIYDVNVSKGTIGRITEYAKELRYFKVVSDRVALFFHPSVLRLMALPHMKGIFWSAAKRHFFHDGAEWINGMREYACPLMLKEVSS